MSDWNFKSLLKIAGQAKNLPLDFPYHAINLGEFLFFSRSQQYLSLPEHDLPYSPCEAEDLLSLYTIVYSLVCGSTIAVSLLGNTKGKCALSFTLHFQF